MAGSQIPGGQSIQGIHKTIESGGLFFVRHISRWYSELYRRHKTGSVLINQSNRAAYRKQAVATKLSFLKILALSAMATAFDSV
jgi:hypothetical protein